MSKENKYYPNVGTIGHIDYGRNFWFLPVSNYLPRHETALASIMKYKSEQKQVIILPIKS